jgi:hypothetical protein
MIANFSDLKESYHNSGNKIFNLMVITPDYEYKKIFNRRPLMTGKFELVSPLKNIVMHATYRDDNSSTPELQRLNDESTPRTIEAYAAKYLNHQGSYNEVYQEGYLLNLNDNNIGWYQTYNSRNPKLGGVESELSSINDCNFDNNVLQNIGRFYNNNESIIDYNSLRNAHSSECRKKNGGTIKKNKKMSKKRNKKSRKYRKKNKR